MAHYTITKKDHSTCVDVILFKTLTDLSCEECDAVIDEGEHNVRSVLRSVFCSDDCIRAYYWGE